MADVFLIVAVTVSILILLVVAVYLLVYYQHPDDHNEAYFPKLIVIIGIMLAGATCLLLPPGAHVHGHTHRTPRASCSAASFAGRSGSESTKTKRGDRAHVAQQSGAHSVIAAAPGTNRACKFVPGWVATTMCVATV